MRPHTLLVVVAGSALAAMLAAGPTPAVATSSVDTGSPRDAVDSPYGSAQGAQVPQAPLPTTYPDIRKLYEAAKYQQVIDAVTAVAPPQAPLTYLAGLTHEKLQQPVRANERFGQLIANRPETDAWLFIGRSATLLNQTPKRVDESIAAARRAVELAPQNPHAHYQLGLALSIKRDYAGASQAFVRTTEIDPAHAYAHYYAGLSFYQVRRIDQVAKHFEAFLRLAPEAPERGQVGSIMRTIRG